MQTTHMSEMLSALGHPIRVQILSRMNAPRRRLSPRGFCDETRMDLSRASYHFRALAESLNSRLRDELLNSEVFTCLEEARVLAEDWRADHNANHPHPALGMLSPARFAASRREAATTSDNRRRPTPDSHSGWTYVRGPASSM
jgi:transposase InsO family protein